MDARDTSMLDLLGKKKISFFSYGLLNYKYSRLQKSQRLIYRLCSLCYARHVILRLLKGAFTAIFWGSTENCGIRKISVI